MLVMNEMEVHATKKLHVDSNEQDELRIINNKGDNIHIKYLSVIAKI